MEEKNILASKWHAVNNYATMDMINPRTHKVGELVIPDTQKKSSRWGTVLTVGPGIVDYNGVFLTPDVEVGEIAYCAAHGQVEVDTWAEGQWSELVTTSIMDILCTYIGEDKVQPLGNYIHIEPLEMSKTTDSGLVLPGSDRRIPSTGRVIKLGKGFQCASGVRIGFQVQEGDIVAYDPLSTLIVDLNHLGVDKKLELVSHANIIAVLVPYVGSLTQLLDEELCAQAERGKGYTFPIEPPSPSELGKITVPVTDEEV